MSSEIEEMKNDIEKVFNAQSTNDMYRTKAFLDNFKYLIFSLIKSDHNDFKAYFIFCTDKVLTDEECISFDVMHKSGRQVYMLEYSEELAKTIKSDVYRFETSEFKLNIPEDVYSLKRKFKLKLKDIPKFRSSYKEASTNHLYDALSDYSYRYSFYSDIDWDVYHNLKELMGVVFFDVYDVNHQSDEYFMLQYIEWNTEPVGIIYKYADKSDFNIRFFNEDVENRFSNKLRTFADNNDEYIIIGDEDEEADNYYGSSIVLNKKLYYTITSPSYCYGYEKLPNPHRCVMTSFSDVQMYPVTIIKQVKDKVHVKLENDEIVELDPSEIFFLNGETILEI